MHRGTNCTSLVTYPIMSLNPSYIDFTLYSIPCLAHRLFTSGWTRCKLWRGMVGNKLKKKHEILNKINVYYKINIQYFKNLKNVPINRRCYSTRWHMILNLLPFLTIFCPCLNLKCIGVCMHYMFQAYSETLLLQGI